MYEQTTKVAAGKERNHVFELVQQEHVTMRSSILYHCLLLVCINLVDVSAYSGRSHTYSTSSPLEGDSIKFPRKPLTKTQAAYYVSSKFRYIYKY